MAKVLVVCCFETGNTEKMALAVADGVKQVKNVEGDCEEGLNRQVLMICAALTVS
jgi:flavodoxin